MLIRNYSLPILRNVLKTAFFVLISGLFFNQFVRAQAIQNTSNSVDSNKRGSLQIDPTTLGLSFNLPMGGYGGRGATLPISMTYSSKLWELQHTNQWESSDPNYPYTVNEIQAFYSQRSIAGWTASTEVPWIEFPSQPYDNNGQPTDYYTPPPHYHVYRALLHLPDGSTHELRKNDTPYSNPPGYVGGGVWLAVDGSRIKVDISTSIVYLPDGSRYLLAAPNGVQYIDRNGNTLTYNTATKKWTDTLGREIGSVPLNNATTGDQEYLLPGVGGVNQKYIFRWKQLGDSGVLTTPQVLRFRGDMRFSYYPEYNTSLSLFTSPDHNVRVCDDDTPGNEFNPIVLSEIILPNQLSYKFTYNVYGEIDKVVLPTGGYERFEYGSSGSISFISGPYDQANRGVIHHWISPTGNAADEAQWTYSAGLLGGFPFPNTVTDPSGARSERVLIKSNSTGSPYGFEDARLGKAKEESTYNASNQMIRRSLVDWVMDGPLSGAYYGSRNPRATKKVEIILDTTGDALAATTILTFDADLNLIKSDIYDYVAVSQSVGQTAAIGSIPQGNLIRSEESTYLVNDPDYSGIAAQYRARNMIGLMTKRVVKNASGVIIGATEFKYDEAAYPILTYASVTGYVDPATTYRGNITTTRNWNNSGSQTWPGWGSSNWITRHTQFDQCGSVRYNWDGNNNYSQVEYTDAFSDGVNRNTYAYQTKTISPKPDAAGTYGTNVELQTKTKYEFSSGKVTWVQDANNQIATTEYEGVLGSGYNSLNRPTHIVRPTGGGETTYEYNDTSGNIWVKARTKRDASNWVESVVYYDKMGREYLSAAYEGSNIWSVTETKFDSQGRTNQLSNPYRVTAATANAVPAAATTTTGKLWTTSTFDALNRVLTVTTPDNALVTTSYNGNQVIVTDQAGKQRKSEGDRLGRLCKVWEAPSGENYLTTYKYDALDNLVQVTQGTQNRYYLYDSLKRLVRARNPEQAIHTNHNLTDPFSNTTNTQWSLAYTYDANSNILTKTDSRNAVIGQAPVSTNLTYDALNRNTTVGYSGYNAYANGTAFVERHYDSAPLGKGKFHWNAKYNTEPDGTLNYNYDFINSYDALGRPTSKSQNFLVYQGGWVQKAFTTLVTYDLASNVTSQTYPSGRIVNYAYDAAGRTTSFSGNLGGTQRNYATAMQYDAAGHVTRETFGTTTALHQKFHYNIRQQLYDVRVGSNINDEWSWDRGALEWYYGSAGWGGSNPDNNGNIIRADHWIPDASGAWNSTTYDYYGYDGLNRVSSTTEYTNSSANTNVTLNYTQGFLYDQWGNRRIDQAATTTSPYINKKDYTVDGATNQLGVPVGQSGAMAFDEVGNLKLDTYTSALTAGMQYDADNKMTSAANGGQQYRYNASGKRVKRIITGTGGGIYWMVYGIGDELVAEYNATSGIPNTTLPSKEFGYRAGQMLIVAESTTAVKWLVQDHLGSTRMEIGASGALSAVTRHDYLPFGEEVAGTMRVGNGFGTATNTKQKFTGYERDDETGLDFAQARMYASKQGRYTSVDPLPASASLIDPQSWNRYAYVGNRPTTTTDPSGMIWIVGSSKEPEWIADEIYRQNPDLYTVWKDRTFKTADGSLVELDPLGPSGNYAGWSYNGQRMGNNGSPLSPPDPGNLIGMAGVGVGLAKVAATVTATTVTTTGVATTTAASSEAAAATVTAVATESAGATIGSLVIRGLGGFFIMLIPQSTGLNDTPPPREVKPILPVAPESAKKSKRSGKEKSTDIPSWAKGNKPNPGESGNDFAKRMFEKYGKKIDNTGPESEYSKLRKYGDRGGK